MDLSGLTLAVEGFGKVGTAVARELQPMGVRLVALSTSRGAVYKRDGFDVDQLLKLYGEAGSDVVNAIDQGEKAVVVRPFSQLCLTYDRCQIRA